ncbi:MAG: pyridoxal phosphate-dependent aminotransferase [Chloroflexi bacterium]|nr:pyridoxal phosphate-dependent aminotransferase [Chloroflexota bacterium]
MKLANRMARLGTEGAFEVLQRARAIEALGHNVIHMEIGEPDFDTPINVVEAGVQALRGGYTHYAPSAGLPELREAIAAHIAASRKIKAGSENVVVVPGAKPIMYFVMTALLEEGDEVIYPDPGFPIYASMANFLGASARPMRLRGSNGWRFDPDEFRATVTPRTRLIILNSPHNPTGTVLTRDELEVIAEAAQQYDCMVLSDEIYERIIYDGTHLSIASLPGMAERTIVLDGFSKAYAMTGWRLGYGVMPVWLADAVTKLQTNSNSCVATFTQLAGLEAIKGRQDDVERMVASFRRRRDVIVSGLNSIPGLRCAMPAGAFYAFPNVEGTGKSSDEVARYLLQEAHVACLRGDGFGDMGAGYLRFAYAQSVEAIEEALDRIDRAVRKLR